MTNQTTPATPRTWRQLHWQRPLDADRVTALFRQWAADQHSPRLVLETRATAAGVIYLLGGRPTTVATAMQLIPRLLPGTSLISFTGERHVPDVAARLKASTRHRPLKSDEPIDTVRAILSVLTQVGAGEELSLQLIPGPPRLPLAVPNNSPSSVVAPWWDVALHGNGGTVDGEKRSALRAKVADHGFACTLRLGVVAADAGRRRQLLLSLLAAIRTTETPGLKLNLRPDARRRLAHADRPWMWPLRLGVRELTGLLAWPLGDDDLPGLVSAHPKRLPPAPGTTKTGVAVARATAPGVEALLRRSTDAALHHSWVVGPTGTGKSTLLASMILQDIAADRAVVVVEPKDLVAEVLARLPDEQIDRVVVLDPLDSAPVGLNPLASVQARPELVADRLLNVMKQLYGAAIGPRSSDILYAGLLTLAQAPDASLVMLPLLLTNRGFRRSVTARLHDPVVLGPFWAQFEAWSDAERAAATAPSLNKLRNFQRPTVRAVLGQRRPRFDLAEVFTDKRVLLVPLQRGALGPETANLIGSLLVSELWQQTLARTAVPAADRHPVMVYLDEAQDFLRLQVDLGEALAQARGLGVGFTIAHQYIRQLPPALRPGLMTNARSRLLFQLEDADARLLAKGHPELTAADLTALSQYEIYASLFSGGRTTPYASGRTLPLPAPTADVAAVRERSRRRYGQPLDEIEAGFVELLEQTGPGPDGDLGLTGRRPRSAS